MSAISWHHSETIVDGPRRGISCDGLHRDAIDIGVAEVAIYTIRAVAAL